MRTDAEMLEFAQACEKIESEGGDVLGYIAEEYPSYTPRATWYRLQKWLGRNKYQLTEGKPKEKGVKYVGRMMELAKGCLEAYGRGEKVYDYLASQGSANPSAYWYQIKATVKLKDPDLYERLSVIRTNERKNTGGTVKAGEPVNTGASYDQEKVTPETVFFGGKEYERLEGEGKPVNEFREKPSPTCCQPARPSGVTVPDEIPEDSLPVCAVKSNVAGKWELARTEGFVHLIYQETQCLTLHKDSWLKLAEEIPLMLKQLGLSK